MKDFYNVNEFKAEAEKKLPKESYEYLKGGAEDERTLQRNISEYQNFQIRPRRLVDVTNVDTSVNILGEKWKSPIVLCPVGTQGIFHKDGEKATARAAHNKEHLMMVSTLATFSYAEIAAQMTRKPWFQLYPTENLDIAKELMRRAEDNGCKVLVLTIDFPVPGNRERATRFLFSTEEKEINMKKGNLDPLVTNETIFNASMTWDIIDWIRGHCEMKIVLKGIMTEEDALLAIKYKVDGIIVSNHGGRQLESDLSTIECLEEVINAVNGKIPVMIDGGIRRGSDIFKAMALGANAVCIGRAFIYGLAANGQKGVEEVLELLQEELVRTMQLAGLPNFHTVEGRFIQRKK